MKREHVKWENVFSHMEVCFLHPFASPFVGRAFAVFLFLLSLCIPHSAIAKERLTVFLEVIGDSPQTEQLIVKNAGAELSALVNVVQVKKPEHASVIVSFIAGTPLPSADKQRELVVYSFAYGINEIGAEANPPVSIPRYITHDVRWCSFDQLGANIRGNIREVDQNFFSLIQ